MSSGSGDSSSQSAESTFSSFWRQLSNTTPTSGGKRRHQNNENEDDQSESEEQSSIVKRRKICVNSSISGTDEASTSPVLSHRKLPQDPTVKCQACFKGRRSCDQAKPKCSACAKKGSVCAPQVHQRPLPMDRIQSGKCDRCAQDWLVCDQDWLLCDSCRKRKYLCASSATHHG